MDLERRDWFAASAVAQVEHRADDEDKPERLSGHAAVYYRDEDPLTEFDIFGDGSFVERVEPGAFDRALKEGQDVRALVDHDPSRILGRSTAGTLSLSTDDAGLAYRIDVPDTQVGRDILVSVRRGDITGSSYAFRVTREEWEDDKEEHRTIRRILDVDLFDVGPVSFPAFAGTDVSVAKRSLASRKMNFARLELARRRLGLTEQICRR